MTDAQIAALARVYAAGLSYGERVYTQPEDALRFAKRSVDGFAEAVGMDPPGVSPDERLARIKAAFSDDSRMFSNPRPTRKQVWDIVKPGSDVITSADWARWFTEAPNARVVLVERLLGLRS